MRRKHLAVVAALTTALATAVPAVAQTEAPTSDPTPVEVVETSPEDLSGSREKIGSNVEPAELAPVDLLDRTPKLGLLGVGDEPRTYLIRLANPAVPTYDGGITGLQPTAPEAPEKLDPSSAPVRAYRGFLVEEQVDLIERIERTVGREVEVPFTYQFAVNGFAAVLTPEEAREIALDPAVASIALDQERELHTDSGPQWSGAEALWDAVAQLGLPADVKGEGIIIGTIDTGISPGNRSFADVGGDGYNHTNPLGAGNFLGACDPANTEQFDPLFPCNDKLIGAYVFGGANTSALDYDGHGSHTASTSGGNVVNDVVVEAPTITTPEFDISGVAPHANVISYLGCCTLSGLTMSIDQAIADGVDVINYSIGSAAPSAAWDDFDTVGFLNARAAGIFVATSNGNAGPFFASTGSPADAPWITSVGASTHDRHNGNQLTGLTSSAGPLANIPGKSVTGALTTPTPIVYAGDFGDAVCGNATGNEANFAGNIVICDRGVVGRVEKSLNVKAQGAVGFVLTNDEIHGDSVLGDEYALAGVFISFDDGETLKEWLADGTGHVGTIAGTTFVVGDQYGDIMSSFSSRGPNGAMDVIVPAVTAPGVDILAALGAGSYDIDVHGFISGTSMSSPHVAGAGALLTQARPEWTPAQAQSALMTTARSTVFNHDGAPATPYAQGAGHIDVGNAVLAGLLFDETHANYLAANPEDGGDPKTLNLASFANTQCLQVCSWQRTATVPVNDSAPVPADVTWAATSTSDAGLDIRVGLSDATLSPGDTTVITVTADVSGGTEGETLFGRITLTPSDSAVPTVTMPMAVVPSAAVLPGEVEITTRRNAGSHLVTGIQSIEVTDFTGSMLGMVLADLHEGSLNQDPTRDDPYDDLGQVDVYLIDVPAGSTRFVAETIEFAMPDLDLFVGQGSTPSSATEVCVSAGPTAQEKCDIPDPDPGTWWVLVQNWAGSASQPDAYVLATAVVPSESLGNAGVDGPSGTVPVGEPYDVTVHWDIDEMTAGDRWYGVAVLGSSPATPDNIGSFPVTILRVEDDVAKTASVEQAAAGDTVSYEISIQPNVTPEDLVYSIVDTIPDGLTIDPASVTGGGVVEGQTITWEVEVPSPVGQVGNYVASTPDTSAQCLAWSGFLDLGPGIPFAGLDGDTVAASAFSNIGPFEHYGGLFPNLIVTEDGLITVTGGYGGQPWVPQTLPNSALPNGVFAPLWSDLELSLVNNRGMRLATSAGVGAAIIQWDDPFEWTADDTAGPSVGAFQAWIYNTVEDFRPEMTFEYEALGALPGVATIGTEDILGDLATAPLNAGDPSTVLEAGGTICLDYEGPTFDVITVGYSVTVDTDAASGTYTNEAIHVTDDPYAQPATASADVEILGAEADLAIVKTGELTETDQIVYTVGVTNNGPDDATGVVVTDELPAEVSYISDTCEAANAPPWTWEIGGLAAEETIECTITVDVVTPGTIVNTATVTGGEADPDPGNNEASATVEVDDEQECTLVITGRHTGPLNVTSGVTCLDGARVTGPVTVKTGAALLSDSSRIIGLLKADGAAEIALCDTRVSGRVSLKGSSMVTLGDPTVDCASNHIVGPVTVNGTVGPSVIAGNRIIGPLACANNDPAPVNNGFPNNVVGPKTGQCKDL